MEKVILGRTGLTVTKLALGGLFISEMGGAFEESKATTLHALEKGINYIDTAPSYWNSETVLGKILREWKGERPVISTKIGSPAPFDPKSKKIFSTRYSAAWNGSGWILSTFLWCTNRSDAIILTGGTTN